LQDLVLCEFETNVGKKKHGMMNLLNRSNSKDWFCVSFLGFSRRSQARAPRLPDDWFSSAGLVTYTQRKWREDD
jgi:hypothetical protein